MPTLVALAELRDKHFQALRTLAAADVDELERHRHVLRRYEIDSVGLGQLSQEFVALEGLVEKFTTELQNSRGSVVEPRTAHILISHVQRHVMNYLGLFRAFIDHTDRRMQKRFGKDAAEVKDFRTACSAHYDGTFAYRFLYKLRNYAQHKHVPVGHIGLSARMGAREPEVDIRFELGFSRDGLLADDTGVWGTSLLAELRAGPPVLPLMPLLNAALISAAGLQLHVQRRDESELFAACAYFEAIQREVSADAFPVLLCADTDDKSQAQVRDVFRMDLVAEIREFYASPAAHR
jgi:hypothetical protein